jgi:hypothetical protein
MADDFMTQFSDYTTIFQDFARKTLTLLTFNKYDVTWFVTNYYKTGG